MPSKYFLPNLIIIIQPSTVVLNRITKPVGLLVPNPKLRMLDQCREVARFLDFSLRTEEAYCDWIRRFIVWSGQLHPSEMGGPEVRGFLSTIIMESNPGCRIASAEAGGSEGGLIERLVIAHPIWRYHHLRKQTLPSLDETSSCLPSLPRLYQPVSLLKSSLNQ